MHDGGYWLIRQPLIRGGLHHHTAANPDAVPPRMLDAINVVQNTRWRVNTWVLDLIRECWTEGDGLGLLPQPYDEPMPARLPDEEWAAMAKEEKTKRKMAAAIIYNRNANLRARRETFLRKLTLAESFRHEEAIWFPHFLDFRGRFYPLPQDLTPQGDDVARGLLMFADGLPLGAAGVAWLSIRLANTFGQDKLTFEDRHAWVVENEALILDSARDPLDGRRFWCEADEPWSFLATCREWELAHRLSDPAKFVSHLPIPLDGVCNGMQILSILGRDPVGARATCCSREPKRYDLYTEVAEAVESIVAEDARCGDEGAINWIGKVTRKTVKRAVMTTPYGVTQRGIRDQLVTDGHTEDLAGGEYKNAEYMQRAICTALERTVVAARDIMVYLQDTAKALADKNLPLKWRTPLGMEVTQSYYNMRSRRVSTLLGTYQMWEEDREMGIDGRKQALAAAPNVVHSLDAAMLAETAIRCNERGISHFSFIHDSYGTHAANTTALYRCLREVAVSQHSSDFLAGFEAGIRAYAPGVSLPDRPPLGTFDIREVLDSPYFFS